MIYAVRESLWPGNNRRTLVEIPNVKLLRLANATAILVKYQKVDVATAHKWVLDGKEHETGLWVDAGKVRYAQPQS
jgi:hypothetical protein